jgi:hypothetical protein
MRQRFLKMAYVRRFRQKYGQTKIKIAKRREGSSLSAFYCFLFYFVFFENIVKQSHHLKNTDMHCTRFIQSTTNFIYRGVVRFWVFLN